MNPPSPALFTASLAIVGWTLTAAEPDLSKLPPSSEKAGLTYAKDIRPLLEASCFNCHGERRQRAGLRLDSLDAVLQGSDEGKVVMPGNSKDSLLVQAIAQIDDETAMPPKRQRGGFGGFGGGGPGGPGEGFPQGWFWHVRPPGAGPANDDAGRQGQRRQAVKSRVRRAGRRLG